MGARLTIRAANFEVRLAKASDEPAFEPLPGFLVERPSPTSESPTTFEAQRISGRTLLGVVVALLGLVALALALVMR